MPVVALFGVDCPLLGDVSVASVVEVSVGLSAGRFPKTPPSTNPNEDAVLAAAATGATLQAVADGHNGDAASHAAIGALARFGEHLTEAPMAEILEVARSAVEGALATSPEAGTTLTLARRRGDVCWVATVGDSRTFRVGRRTRYLGTASPFWNTSTIAGPLPAVSRHRIGDDWLVVASDGLMDFLGRNHRRRVASLVSGTPEESVRRLIDAALDGAAGDHVACTVAGRC